MKKINHKKLLCICLSIAMLVSMFVVTASAYSTYVGSDSTATAASVYLYQDTYTVKVTNSGQFNCSVWFQKGSSMIGQKTLYYNGDLRVDTWKPWVSSAGTYAFKIYNNGSAAMTFYTSVTRGS